MAKTTKNKMIRKNFLLKCLVPYGGARGRFRWSPKSDNMGH